LTSAALIYFPAGSAALADTDRVLLGELARAVQGLSSALLVAGHAAREGVADDQGGQRAAMRALSQARAEAVRRELLRQGVAADRVRVEAFGDERPDFDESRPTGIAGNRRVEVLIAP
jgi:outer membrane protein OmpA-like peptidoglycan-associated protein